jgi:hypothetical protein
MAAAIWSSGDAMVDVCATAMVTTKTPNVAASPEITRMLFLPCSGK